MWLKQVVRLLCLSVYCIRGARAAIMRVLDLFITTWTIGSTLWDSSICSGSLLSLLLMFLGVLLLSSCCNLCRNARKDGWRFNAAVERVGPEISNTNWADILDLKIEKMKGYSTASAIEYCEKKTFLQ